MRKNLPSISKRITFDFFLVLTAHKKRPLRFDAPSFVKCQTKIITMTQVVIAHLVDISVNTNRNLCNSSICNLC